MTKPTDTDLKKWNGILKNTPESPPPVESKPQRKRRKPKAKRDSQKPRSDRSKLPSWEDTPDLTSPFARATSFGGACRSGTKMRKERGPRAPFTSKECGYAPKKGALQAEAELEFKPEQRLIKRRDNDNPPDDK